MKQKRGHIMQNIIPEDSQEQTVLTSQVNSASGSQPPLDNVVNPAQPGSKQPFFYTQEDDLDLHLPLVEEQDDQAGQSSPFVLPFQNSAAMPTLAQMDAQGAHGPMGTSLASAPPVGKLRRGSFHIVKILLIASVVLITVIGATFFVFAQSATSPGTTQVNGTQTNGTTRTSPVSTAKPTQGIPAKTKTPTPGSSSQATVNPPSNQRQGNQNQEQGTQGNSTSPSSSVPSAQLLSQIGWTQAGLSFGDAIEALRTGTTFTDREMSYDYRNIGTRAAHSGTLTGSTFLLTPGGLARFAQNDVRMINNRLYDKIHNGKIIQQVVNAQPSLDQFQVVQVQGQQRKFAWVNVAFELFQSKIDSASGKRTESLDLDPTTGQPVIHHMVVVLVRVSPQNQGANAPMGGTGWLVNVYALDANTLPAIATNPSL
jgi:hypothetical protein